MRNKEVVRYLGRREATTAALNRSSTNIQSSKSSSPMRGKAMRVVEATLSIPSGLAYVTGVSKVDHVNSFQDLEVRRRYSEFHSLRATLVNLHPTLIIPPIPEKHSMADYAAKPTKAKEDAGIIDLRKRMLTMFLNRCKKMKEVREDGVWWRFLDPNASWVSENEVAICTYLITVIRAKFYIHTLWHQYQRAL